MKVLVVDDDSANRTILKAYLRDKAETVDTAANGREAVEAFIRALDQGASYNLVCMDIMMPGMDGHEALKRIRQIENERRVAPGQEIKALVITCLEDQKNVCQAFFHGQATCYLTKPLNKEDFRQALASIGV